MWCTLWNQFWSRPSRQGSHGVSRHPLTCTTFFRSNRTAACGTQIPERGCQKAVMVTVQVSVRVCSIDYILHAPWQLFTLVFSKVVKRRGLLKPTDPWCFLTRYKNISVRIKISVCLISYLFVCLPFSCLQASLYQWILLGQLLKNFSFPSCLMETYHLDASAMSRTSVPCLKLTLVPDSFSLVHSEA